MSKPQLQKATITVLDGADKNKIITVLFNPTEYSFDRTNSYKATAVPGLGSPILQFVNGECDRDRVALPVQHRPEHHQRVAVLGAQRPAAAVVAQRQAQHGRARRAFKARVAAALQPPEIATARPPRAGPPPSPHAS